MNQNSKIFVAGHRGLVGSAVVRMLRRRGYTNLILKTRAELDLLDQAAVHQFFKKEQIEYVIDAAARVGGILYNKQFQTEFLYENIMIAANVIHAAAEYGVQKLLFLGSSCIYPKFAQQPIQETALLSGALEPTNEGYALAKIAGLKMCEKYMTQYGKQFISAMPTNLYGPADNFHPERSHVIPGLLRRFHEAKISNAPEVTIWGTGTPKREFLYVDDLAEAIHVLLDRYSQPNTINVGTGEDCTIAELAEAIKEVVGFKGSITFDTSKPDGTPRKVLDVSRMKSLGWAPQVPLNAGLELAYRWAIDNKVFNPQPTTIIICDQQLSSSLPHSGEAPTGANSAQPVPAVPSRYSGSPR
ncbi:MAG: GDP-L-fucose synthase [Proteobacteria bacterium]|nr:GDP-L-fucose synthase [Pseudomonadota bacterium]